MEFLYIAFKAVHYIGVVSVTEVEQGVPSVSVIFVSRNSSKDKNYRRKGKNADYFRKLAQPAFKQYKRARPKIIGQTLFIFIA